MYGDLSSGIMVPVQRQQGFTDCGLFAIAIALDLCLGKRDPSELDYIQEVMRPFLYQCFEQGHLRCFPVQSRYEDEMDLLCDQFRHQMHT